MYILKRLINIIYKWLFTVKHIERSSERNYWETSIRLNETNDFGFVSYFDIFKSLLWSIGFAPETITTSPSFHLMKLQFILTTSVVWDLLLRLRKCLYNMKYWFYITSWQNKNVTKVNSLVKQFIGIT